jgi:tRNA pseudouridine38-40 synthase
VEDSDIVERINANLSPQIRVWGFERTNNGFSAYQLCDSRIYEYLIPTHSFLPPHPSSYLGKKISEMAARHGDEEGLSQRQDEVKDFWEKVDEEQIKPILDRYDEKTKMVLEKALYLRGDEEASRDQEGQSADTKSGAEFDNSKPDTQPVADRRGTVKESREPTLIYEAIKKLRNAYVTAKRAYRIHPSRLKRVREALSLYEGTRNYHNYTIQKSFSDPSAKRVIKSFVVNPNPILINGTEWLSLKVHGQSFMMHQIRKMVGMVALTVRCGCDPKRITESYGPEKISIPKAPSLGLLLERPVFDSYNKRAKGDLGKEPIDFDKFRKEMDEFKQREIYERIYRDEEKDNV